MKIDYTFKHNKAVSFFNYLKNFLKKDVPQEQILEELQKLCLDIAYHEYSRHLTTDAADKEQRCATMGCNNLVNTEPHIHCDDCLGR